jgi:UTP--glucose-1-phosphate uridylyltransferase
MIKKAILPVAGVGSRFLPVTKSSPKEMLPIVDKPVIQLIVEEAVNSGIEEIIFVTGKTKRAIEDYFDPDYDLIKTLEKQKKMEPLRQLKNLEQIAKITYVRQSQPLGDGNAILCAEHCIFKDEDFAVLFGDDIIDNEVPALKQLLNNYEKNNSSVIGVQNIYGREIEKYGVTGVNFETRKIEKLQEKPKYEDAVSSLGIIGKYVCKYEVLDAIKKSSKINSDGEQRLVDGFNYLLKNKKDIYAQIIEGKRYDTGSKLGWLRANIAYALKNPVLSPEIISDLERFLS